MESKGGDKDSSSKEMHEPKETPASFDILANDAEVKEALAESTSFTALMEMQANQSEGDDPSRESAQKAETPSRQADSQRGPGSQATKGNAECETTTPALLRASSVETIKGRDPNPAIFVQDFPLTTLAVMNSPSTSVKPAKFRSSNIVVPDYRWTKDEGMIASPTSPFLDLSTMRPTSKTLQEPGVAHSLLAPVSIASWADQVSPRTIISPVQYANAPPLQTWLKPKVVMVNSLGADKGTTQSDATSPEALEKSPFLPITAYSFSTDSGSPPASPSEQRQEVVTPENEQVDLPAVGVYSDAAPYNSCAQPDGNTWQHQGHVDQYLSDSCPAYRDTLAPVPLPAWMVDAYLLQMSQHPANEMWYNPLSSGYGIPKSKFMLAKQLAKQARAGDLPPQVPQSKTNYRSTWSETG